MVPILAINNSISFLICLVSFLKLFKAYKTNRNLILFDFTRFYFFLMLFFLALALPGLVLKDEIYASISILTSHFFIFISAAYFIRVPLKLLKLDELKNLLFGISLFFSVYLLAMNTFLFQPAKTFKVNQFYYLDTAEPIWFSFLMGSLLGLVIILAIIFFIIEGIKSKDKLIKTKSFMIGGGMSFLFIASFSNYMLHFLPDFSFTAYLLASILAWVGLLVILVGIMSKKFYFE